MAKAKPYTKFIREFKKEDHMLLEKHEDIVLISEGHAIYSIPYYVYDIDFRIASPRFCELEDGVLYRADNKKEIPHKTASSNTLSNIRKKMIVDSNTRPFKRTNWKLNIESNDVRLFVAYCDEYAAINQRFLDLADNLGIDTSIATGSKHIAPLAFNGGDAVIVPVHLGVPSDWEDLRRLANISTKETER